MEPEVNLNTLNDGSGNNDETSYSVKQNEVMKNSKKTTSLLKELLTRGYGEASSKHKLASLTDESVARTTPTSEVAGKSAEEVLSASLPSDAASKLAPPMSSISGASKETNLTAELVPGTSAIPEHASKTNELEFISTSATSTDLSNEKSNNSTKDLSVEPVRGGPSFQGSQNVSDRYCPREQVGDLLVEQVRSGDPLATDDDEPLAKRKKTSIYTKDEGPKWYKVKGNLVTAPIITKNLPNMFTEFPIYGRPKNEEFATFSKNKIRDFMGPDLTDEEFENLAKYCSPSHLKTGVEINMPTTYPMHYGLITTRQNEKMIVDQAGSTEGINLCLQKKLQLRMEKDVNNMFSLKLKYRGIRMIPLTEDEKATPTVMIGKPLEPGKDLIFRVRVYRPFLYNFKNFKQSNRTRHSVFSCDIVMVGRQKLSLLRDRIVCANDVGMRVDVSGNPEDLPTTSAKDVFPSGFLFINNVFYVDSRVGCADHTAGLRAWAVTRGLGEFPVRDICAVRLDEIVVKLGHPEVYVHQGNCEHLFTISEVRLLSPRDPARLSAYPAHSAVTQHQTVYCTTCAEFGAKWIVAGCERVPFDPAFFCETCFKLYLYSGAQKIGDFKAYCYRGNEINMLKPS